VDWSKLPDFLAVALLTSAFASVARRGQTAVSGVWLTGWLMIALHFAAFTFLPAPGHWGDLAAFIGLASLACGGLLFSWASVPHRKQQPASRWMLAALLVTNTLYLGLLVIYPVASWALAPAAVLVGALPLTITLIALQRFQHPLRWTVTSLFAILSISLLVLQHRGDAGLALAPAAVFLIIYLDCSIHFWYVYRRATTGAFITIAGFFAWASVFVVAPSMGALFPNLHLESEVWNLPKYIVAIGMILLLLEDQIEHNRYLALHDELTGLPNRRLFHDRLASALERARRTGSQVALLLIDLDHFKQVNDSVGHHAGDQLLKNVSTLFLGRVRRSDTVARTGGDEFSVILEEPMTRADAIRVGRTLVGLLDNPLELDGHAVRVGATVGVAVFPDDASDAEGLCIAADKRMYSSKNALKGESAGASPRPFVHKKFQPAKAQQGL
jgi:diguanylate cyclase